jgi:hypothetical protein
MFRRIPAASAGIAVVVILMASTSQGYAEDEPPSHPGPWPIWNWYNHQPRVDAAHNDDLTPQDARKVDQLYWELEGQSPDRTNRCHTKSIPPQERDQCRAEGGARVLPSRPVPEIMGPSR